MTSASSSSNAATTDNEGLLHLPTPLTFPSFPFQPPYTIQVSLMHHLYSSIEDRKLAIIESPTGTGKTLSLLCAGLTWLEDDRGRAKKGKLAESAKLHSTNEPAWVLTQTLDRLRQEMEADEQEYIERLAKARKREMALKKKAGARVHVHKKHKPTTKVEKKEGVEDEDEEFLPDSDRPYRDNGHEYDNLSPEVRALMQKLEKQSRSGEDTDLADPITCTKIYYASRTHSQLSQVLPEMMRLKLSPPSSSTAIASRGHAPQPSSLKRPYDAVNDEDPIHAYSRVVSLGSRKQLCINEDVRKMRDMDEGCRALLEAKGSEKRCPHLPPSDEEYRMLEFRDQILASPKDIEDLAEAGHISNVCPYFGSRRAIPQAEVVTLPYNLLLQKSAREALGIDLKDQIVIIDEAHNLIQTLLSLSTTRLTSHTITTTLGQLRAYLERFRTRLSAGHALHLKRLVVFLHALGMYLEDWAGGSPNCGTGEKDLKNGEKNTTKTTHGTPKQPQPPSRQKTKMKTEVITISALLERLGKRVAGINLLEIEKYLRSSKIAHKIAGYSDRKSEQAQQGADSKRNKRNAGATPPLYDVEAFIVSLSGRNDDGRITLSTLPTTGVDQSQSTTPTVEVKFQLLNPAPHFAEVIADARSVILAGGTMSPMSDIINQLFSDVPLSRISTFSCGHIIPPESLQTLVVPKGLKGAELEYTAAKQKDPAVIAELGQILVNLAACIHYGMVVFFPSYAFLNAAKDAWGKGGLLERLQGKKKVLFEPEDGTQCERVLREYAAEIESPSTNRGKQAGALLFAVIGAKLSEGLNFKDNLARAVIVVGLPYANLGSPELQERLRYVKQLAIEKKVVRKEGEKDAAAELYENMCMNAVNQSIGRAIRHQNDWASLILLDRRYATAKIQKKLPGWIGDRVSVMESFGQAMKALGAFYRGKAATVAG